MVQICFFYKQKTAYEMRISDWSSDVCSSDLLVTGASTGWGRASALRLAASYQAKPLIVGRRLDNLRELQSEIGERFNVPCEIIVADQREIEGREKIAAKVIELKVNAAFLAAGLTRAGRSEERRVGKECVSKGRNR